jgi:beta-glucosidase/6-phospho-beta-glucosidase/beta-galactosidase
VQADPNSPYGIDAHTLPKSALSLAVEAGIAWVRIDINWKAIEGRDTYGNKKFNWSAEGTDAVINNAYNLGLNILANLGNDVPSYYNEGGGKWFPYYHVPDWQEFLTKLVFRYKGKIKYWGVE